MSVLVFGEPLTISSGSRKSFQIHITSIMTMVVVTDFRSGKSGQLAELEPHRRKLVKEALDYYKIIRSDIPHSTPFWPLGLPEVRANGLASGCGAGIAVMLQYGGLPEKLQMSNCR